MGTSNRTKGGINQGGGTASHGQKQTGAKTLSSGGMMKSPKGGNAGGKSGGGKKC